MLPTVDNYRVTYTGRRGLFSVVVSAGSASEAIDLARAGRQVVGTPPAVEDDDRVSSVACITNFGPRRA